MKTKEKIGAYVFMASALALTYGLYKRFSKESSYDEARNGQIIALTSLLTGMAGLLIIGDQNKK